MKTSVRKIIVFIFIILSSDVALEVSGCSKLAIGRHCVYFMGQPGLFLFIFVLFKHKFYRKTVGFSGIRTGIVRLEGEHADHLTTTTARVYIEQERLRHLAAVNFTLKSLTGSEIP